MKNITVSVDDETYRRARIKAAERDSSVSRLVRDFLKRLADEEGEVHSFADRQTVQIDEDRERRVDEIVARFQASIPPDAPWYEEIMADMYDENGLPK